MSDFLRGPFGGDDTSDTVLGSSEHVPESEQILLGLLSELPDHARALVEKIGIESAKVEETSAREVAMIREAAEKKVAEIEGKADQRRKAVLQHAIDQLGQFQKDLFRAGELPQALATYVQIQALKARLMNVLPDPGNLLNHQHIGKTYYFRVCGDKQGPVWGSGIYTADSALRVAAVHAGAVEFSEEGIVKVSIVDMTGVHIRGSLQNGVMSMDWGAYPVGYRVAKG